MALLSVKKCSCPGMLAGGKRTRNQVCHHLIASKGGKLRNHMMNLLHPSFLVGGIKHEVAYIAKSSSNKSFLRTSPNAKSAADKISYINLLPLSA